MGFKSGAEWNGNRNGRPVGALASRTIQLREKARKMGCDPLEVMINEIRDLLREASSVQPIDPADPNAVSAAAIARRILRTQAVEVAAKLAPYLHPKLATIELTGNDDKPIRIAAAEARDRAVGAVLGLAAAVGTRANGEDDSRSAA